MNASQLRYLEIVHLGPKHKSCILLHSEGLQNAPKMSQSSFWVLCIFFILKVSEMLQNTLNDFGSFGVEWMLLLQNDLCNFGAKKLCIQDRNTSIASFYFPKVYEMFQNTPNNHLGLME
jgi:hypothetical protein